MNGATPEALALAAVAIPLAGALAIAALGARPNLREAATLVTALATLASVAGLVGPVLAGARPHVALVEMMPGVSLAFDIEPLGLMFALIASSLWILNSLYSIGYMRAGDEPRQTTFYVCFALAIASAIGVAFAGNLVTLFLFYEALTLSTFPLVIHKQTPEAMRAGRIYLLLLLGASMVLFLPAIVATWLVAGSLDFATGGVLAGRLGPLATGFLLALYVFGIGKAAMMPLHFWLPAAMVAPTPVSALLHAVAVVKAGVFSILKIVAYVFGADALAVGGGNGWLIAAACASLLIASLVALMQDDLKARLAYSTVSQLAYVVLGAALATPAGVAGAALQIATHAVGKITLFFCAGAIYVAHHKSRVSQLDGIGRRMPVTMTCFLVGSLSIIGLPPFAGFWSKWTLGVGALQAGQPLVVAVLMASSVLSAAYLLPIAFRAFFAPPAGEEREAVEEAPWPCVAALATTALLTVVLFFGADALRALLAPVAAAS